VPRLNYCVHLFLYFSVLFLPHPNNRIFNLHLGLQQCFQPARVHFRPNARRRPNARQTPGDAITGRGPTRGPARWHLPKPQGSRGPARRRRAGSASPSVLKSHSTATTAARRSLRYQAGGPGTRARQGPGRRPGGINGQPPPPKPPPSTRAPCSVTASPSLNQATGWIL
jgi:hypothetical protein